MSELMKKIFGRITDQSDNNLVLLSFGVTIDFIKSLDSDNPGGWIGSASVKDGGQFELFTAYDMPVVDTVAYRIFKDGELVTDGTVTVDNFAAHIQVTDTVYAALKAFTDSGTTEADKIAGTVLNVNGFPVAGTLVVYNVGLTGSSAISGASVTTNSSGYYEYVFTTTPPKAIQVVFTYPGMEAAVTSEIVYNPQGLVTLDLTIPLETEGDNTPTEFGLLYDKISAAAGTSLVSVSADKSALLAGMTGENETLVKMLLLAYAFNQKIAASEMVYYGIMRTTMQTSQEVLVNMSLEDLTNALKLAVNLNIIGHLDDEVIDAYVPQIKSGAKAIILGTSALPVADSKGIRVLSTAITDTKLSKFLEYYYTHDMSDADFWNVTNLQGNSSGLTTADIEKVKAAIVYGVMTGNNPAMVTKLTAVDLKTIVSYSSAQWVTAIESVRRSSDFVYPDEIAVYETDDEKKNAYAENLKTNFSGAYRTLAVGQGIVTDSSSTFPQLKANLNTFMAANPSFDLLRTPSNKIAELFPASSPTTSFIEEVATVQRLNVIAPSFGDVVAIKKLGLTSASDVVQMSKADYVTALTTAAGSTISAANAALSYSNAVNTVVLSQTIALAAYAMVDISIPSIYPAGAVADADLRGLFGTIDYCSCNECSSVFSPAAYLVDSLELLRQNNPDAYNQLRARRPDLWEVKLTCKNTNTSLPYIDLGNEILEDMVRAAGTDAATTGVFNYAVEAYNTGVDDDGVSIPGVNEKTLEAIPENIDKPTLSSAYQKLKAAQYPWSAPYNFFQEQVKEHLNLIDVASYKLPQTFSSKQQWISINDIDAACVYLGITKNANAYRSDYAIITDTFQSDDTTVSPSDTPSFRLRKYYGINRSRKITVPSFTLSGTTYPAGSFPYIVNPANRTQYITIPDSATLINSQLIFQQASSGLYEVVTPAVSTYFMSRVDILMQQSGLSLIDILELLDCGYIAPSGTLIMDGNPQTTCDTSKLFISGLTENHLRSIHRFIRLQRKTGWSKYELDQVFKILNIASGDSITANMIIAVAQIKRLTEVLKCNVLDILPFWGDFSSLVYRKYGNGDVPEQKMMTQYEQIFRNPASDIAQLTDYPFPLNADMLAWKNNTLSSPPPPSAAFSNVKYLLGALQMSEKDFNQLFEYYNASGNNLNTIFELESGQFKFSYNNVLKLYREFKLCRLLKLSIADWCVFRSWIANLSGVNPFVTVNTTSPVLLDAVFTFIDKVNLLKGSGFSTDDVRYVFEDKFTTTASLEAKSKALNIQAQNLRTALSKLTVSFVEGSSEIIDSKSLQTKLETIMSIEDADFIVNTVGRFVLAEFTTPSTSYAFTTEQVTRFNGLLPEGVSSTLVTGTFTSSTNVNVRLASIDNIFNNEILKTQLKSSLAAANKMDLDITDLLLQKIVAGSQNAYNVLLQQSFITGSGTLDSNVLQVVEKFIKAAMVIQLYKLTLSEVDFVISQNATLAIPDIANLPVGMLWNGTSTAATVYQQCVNLFDWMAVRARISPSPTGIFQVLKAVLDLTPGIASALDRKQTWFDAFMLAVQVSEADLAILAGARNTISATGIFNFDFSGTTAPYLPFNYKKLLDCFELQAELEVNMQTCKSMADAAILADTQANADVVVQAIKSRFGDSDWLEQVKPVNDRLRISRRDAMVAYLLAYPPNKYRNEWLTANDIYETLLIDIQMMPIVKTSRIKQAISSVQLFVDRCLLQEEKLVNGTGYISLAADTQTQWGLWRKWYRIWEANRRIFVYPENWIEPELRDDKSPFFKDLEKFIKQNEVNSDTMKDAYRGYLESLDEVAHMDIVSYFTETVSDDVVVHVWGRTKSDPQMYYYRKRVQKVWTAWEKMDTQVDGNNFVALKWRGRIRLYWLNVTQKTVQKRQPKLTSGDEPAAAPERYLDIKLCWTELNNGKWQPKKIGKESLETIPWKTSQISEILWNSMKINVWLTHKTPYYTSKAYDDTLDYYIKSLIPFCKSNADNDLEIVVLGHKRYIKLDEFSSQKMADYTGISPNPANSDNAWAAFLNDSQYKNAFDNTENRFNDFYFADNFKNCKYEPLSAGTFTVKQNKVLAKRSQTGVSSTYLGLLSSGTYFSTDSQYRYNKTITDGYKHTDSTSLLKLAPAFTNAPTPDKSVVLCGMGPNVSFPGFFYNDYNSSFYVEKVSGDLSVAVPSTLSVSGSSFANQISTALLTSVNISSANGVQVASRSTVTALPLSTASASLLSSNAILNTVSSIQSKYRFYPFNYYNVEDLMTQLDVNGVEGLFDWEFTESMQDDYLNFATTYQPTANVIQYYPTTSVSDEAKAYPMSSLDFRRDSPTAIYNWELFFHIPLLIANKLMQDQQFDEALKWFHFIFNPSNESGTSHGNGSERFWQFLPFYKEALAGVRSIQEIMDDYDGNLADSVRQWAADPFKPHLVARTRVSAYMRTVVMKYLDNLVNWGDQLFRRDTMESINEATLLYVLAAQILGRPPVSIPPRINPDPMSYSQLIQGQMNAFSNAAVLVQTIMAPSGSNQSTAVSSVGSTTLRYFAIPANNKLLSYWDVVADRLFKIRNSQNIDGVERQLALFEPPIDPALLVRAAAAGVSLSDAVNGLFAPLPQYRFNILQQKASEMVQEVKSLGSSLLSAIEKKDAEQISLLRSSQEIDVMDSMREVKQMQLQEAQTQVAALQNQYDSTTIRRDYYSELLEGGLNEYEQSQIDSMKLSIPLKIAEGIGNTLGGALHAIPDVKVGSPFTLGLTVGGTHFGTAAIAAASAIGIASTVNDIKGSMAGIKGGYERRKADWSLQLKLANTELKQLEKQLVAAEIRASITDKEIQIQDLQLSNAIALDAAMHDKYSNEDLYDWMISEISLTYFNCYKLAYDLAKRAEQCYNFELGLNAAFVEFGHWNTLKKGLLAGEGLNYDLKRMDASYLEMNKRQHEMTKHVSLAMLDPQELIKLRSGEKANINIPEWLFDMDYPGHYFRRVKSVSVSIPCVAGPYSTVSAKLTLNSSKYRKSAIVSGSYGASENYETVLGGAQSIATSSGQNDSGMFEMNFRDERYLPFEGAGVDSSWTLELPAPYASFDKSSISDVIIHINYTAKYDGKLAQTAEAALNEFVTEAITSGPLSRYFSLKHEFSEEWYQGFENPVVTTGSALNGVKVNLPLFQNRGLYPDYGNGQSIYIPGTGSITVFVQFKEKQTGDYSLIFTDADSATYALSYLDAGNKVIAKAAVGLNDSITVPDSPTADVRSLVIYKNGSSTPVPESEIEDIYIVIDYTLSAS